MGEVDIKEIAKLARLKLNDEEIEKFSRDLEEVKKMFDEIDKIDVKEEPCFQPVEVKNVMRKDEVGKSANLEEIFSNTEHKEDNLFKGPKV
jgi:aspartyl-tRNA(Asn)/glutamyl-tRNA(Gln) amidotransferase subunit C